MLHFSAGFQPLKAHDRIMASVASLLCSHQNRKRNHQQMSSETRHSCNSHLLPESSSQHAQISSDSLFNFNIPPFRRSVDLRRPIMSQSTQHVIDLTEDRSSPVTSQVMQPPFSHSEGQRGAQRPPRFDRDIINIDDPEDEAVDLRENSPEIQFLTSRPRSRSLSTTRQARQQSNFRQRRHTPAIRSPGRRPQHVSVRFTGAPDESHGHQNAGWLFHPFAPRVNTNTPRTHEDELIEWENFPNGNFELPAHLDYLMPAFNLEEPAARRQPQPRLPTYDPPTPAQEGFTRTPKEDDVLVCPNCDDELGLGDDEVKRQVWVVKACGHVYCGECAKNRSTSRKPLLSTTSKRIKPFSKCVVDECGKNVSHVKSVIQVYM